MRFCVLSSGSKANSTFIEAGGRRFLIDCGLSGRQAELRLSEIGVEPASLSAIIVTHEHTDHINGIGTLSRKYKLPVYANDGTSKFLGKVYAHERFSTGETFSVGQAEVHPFSIVHDAADPVGFSIVAEGVKFVYLTDLGRVTTLVRENASGAHAIVLESNHDQQMLQDCDYTWQLKQRIASTHGHLCNETAGQLLADIFHPELFHVVLGHLSENSNTPTLALECANRYLREAGERARGLKTLVCGSIYAGSGVLSCLYPEDGLALAI